MFPIKKGYNERFTFRFRDANPVSHGKEGREDGS